MSSIVNGILDVANALDKVLTDIISVVENIANSLPMPEASMSGTLDALVNDMIGTMAATFRVAAQSLRLALNVVEIPLDLGKAYRMPSEPSPWNI